VGKSCDYVGLPTEKIRDIKVIRLNVGYLYPFYLILAAFVVLLSGVFSFTSVEHQVMTA
jgi:hypothetical protein